MEPYSLSGKWYRGNLHTHSTNSDGYMSPKAICAAYQSAGYDFISLTDHFLERYDFPITDTTPFRSSKFTTILGAELHTGTTELGVLWHILAVGLPPDFARYAEGETGPEVAKRARTAGAFVTAAHPAWYGLTIEDVVSLGDIHAVETFNATAIDDNDRGDSWYVLDQLLTQGYRLNALATDDAHCHPARYDLHRGWVWVRSNSNEPADLLAALKAGHYYSSTGPQIHHIELAGDTIRVECSPAERIFITGCGSTKQYSHSAWLTQAEIRLDNFAISPYLRVTVRDHRGGRAWSNPIWRP